MFHTLMQLAWRPLFHTSSCVIGNLFAAAASLDLLLFALLVAFAVHDATTDAVVSVESVDFVVAAVFLPHF